MESGTYSRKEDRGSCLDNLLIRTLLASCQTDLEQAV